jgi:hypothetical protein
MNYESNSFVVGDQVIAFEWFRKNAWATPEVREYAGDVVIVKDGWVWVDTMFGSLAFRPQDVEYADAPF